MDTKSLAVQRKERKPWIAGVLSLAQPGLGHLYVGRWELGISWYLVFLLLGCAYFLIAQSPFLPSVINAGGVLVLLGGYLLVVRSACRHAQTVRYTYSPKSWNRWYLYLGALVVGASISSVLAQAAKEFIVQAYKIPSRSMAPTLLIGDHIYADKMCYRFFKQPARGEVIVFKYPEDESKDFIKRIVGMPGDTVELRNKQLLLNGVSVDDHSYTQRVDPGIIDRSVNPRDNFGPVTVPDNSYFVLGDNRDQSLDSRFWGFVEASKIQGKATIIYWSWSGAGRWNEWVRWGRIGQKIQ